MSDFFSIMAAPTLACLLLVGIFAHLGGHIVRRGVLFVDLALAQIAALGVTFAVILGYPVNGPQAFGLALAAAAIGALIFTFTRLRNSQVPQEAIIGITYVVAAALMVLLVDRAPHGAEHIKYLLVGNILWVTSSEVTRIAVVAIVVGLLHYYFEPQFSAASRNAIENPSSGASRLWDFLFYLSVALVVTASVQAAGVLLIFTFLILPAVVGILTASQPHRQLITAWAVGTLVSVGGAALSYRFDTPTAATIICLAGIVLVVVGAAGGVVLRRGS